jgi:transposase
MKYTKFQPWMNRGKYGPPEITEKLSEENEKGYRELTKDRKYSQKWAEYNEAQTREKIVFYRLLDELLNIIPNRVYTFGRPRKSLRDMLFCCMIKTYSNTSARRIISELELARRANCIRDTCHFNTLLNYFEDVGLAIVLHYLISVSALPLKNVENKFAVDSTGFGTLRFDRWYEEKYGEGSDMGKYRKAHVICGVATQIVTKAEITRSNVADTKMFKPLLEATSEHFNISAICADKAYSSRANLKLAKSLNCLPYIPFKKGSTRKSKGSPMWAKMYQMFSMHYYEFAQEYHDRSNVESCFAMIKIKFGDFCRCKSEQSQDNEILCKILCHNIVVLVHEIFNRNLDINFLASSKMLPAQKVV